MLVFRKRVKTLFATGSHPFTGPPVQCRNGLHPHKPLPVPARTDVLIERLDAVSAPPPYSPA